MQTTAPCPFGCERIPYLRNLFIYPRHDRAGLVLVGAVEPAEAGNRQTRFGNYPANGPADNICCLGEHCVAQTSGVVVHLDQSDCLAPDRLDILLQPFARLLQRRLPRAGLLQELARGRLRLLTGAINVVLDLRYEAVDPL